MTKAIQQIDLWAEDVIASITGTEVMQQDGVFLAKLEPLADPADSRKRAARPGPCSATLPFRVAEALQRRFARRLE